MYRISSSYVGMLVAMLQAEGLDAVRLCREAGIDMCLLAQEDAFFTRASAYRLMALAELDSDNPNLGLKAAVHFKPGSFQLVGYVMMSSANLKQALEHFVRFHLLLGNGVTLALSPEQGGRLRLTCLEHPEEGCPRNRAFEDAGAAALLGFCRWLMGGGLPQPLQFDFVHDEPGNLPEYQQLFGCSLRFGAQHTSVLFDQQELLRPLSTANEALALLHKRFAEFRLGQLGGVSLGGRVRGLIIERLGQEGCDMESIGLALCMSKRTLQRGLEKEGLKFKDILGDVRRQSADYYLCRSSYSLTQVAEYLGFHDQSSFHKACLRWFGRSPGRYRLDEGEQSTPHEDVSDAAHQADDQCIDDIDEEAADQRNDNERLVRGSVALSNCRHVDDGRCS
ncbi:transcriptional regulator, AraC family [Pseudomonas extremaustralis]|nr:PhbR [Pseudomonas sp. USM4-55]EZI29224.1 AraC family transcriptional regulator [Pseudomonas extremaustralis 14-3 substr. 14-3b]CDM42642.1 Transcription activator in PHB biosynthesis, AraC family [Pseudomonas oleovorans CECT 5344]CDR93264.1 Transcription activator in PHB biosynthesis, AraC family [Pseudomonas oleovorans]SDF55198.1 transcriptional regulator, AraC family [Pseudomonas extremaustralis]